MLMIVDLICMQMTLFYMQTQLSLHFIQVMILYKEPSTTKQIK